MALGIGSVGGIQPVDLWRAGGTGAASAITPTGAGAIDGPITGTGAAGSVGQGGTGSFIDAIGEAMERLNAGLVGADAAMASFASGGSADLHTVILQMQEASLQLKLGVQVRDRLLEAYQDIMRLQV